ncbi:TonB-dependent receptor [Flavobacterium sp.]|uniref:TonB-dependent receptor n=1 Tax=Flavobacterium sp. TaxID=239 RepID=UPI00261B2B6D|nr:TonB-dependent receptor [Flavobacterium sp.]
MKNSIAIFIVIFLFAKSYSQSNEISFEFKELNLKSILTKLENETSYKMYYTDDWFKNDTILKSNNFSKKGIDIILNTVLDETDFNYFIESNNIILSKNQYIYSEFPNELLNLRNKNNELNNYVIGEIEKPTYEKEYESTNKEQQTINYIGKQQKNSKKTLKLSGLITDIDKKSVSNVVINVKNRGIKTTSNESGYFTLNLPSGLNIIEVESMLHKKYTKKIVIYNDGILNINLKENIKLIEEVIINQKAKEKISSTITGVTSIDIENIKNIPLVLGERDIFKVATILPGIKTTGEGSAGFNVRGGKEDQNLILIDKAVIYNSSHFFGFFSAVNPFSIKKADIYKGSIPAEFGGRLSSVFDISTKNGNKNKLSGEGGIGPVTSNLMGEVPIKKDKSSLFFAGRATYSGWILRSLKNEKLKKSQASFYDAMLKYDHLINEKNTLSTTLYFSDDKYSITSDSLFNYNNRLVSINWNHKFNTKIKTRTTLSNSDYVFNINYESSSDKNFDLQYRVNETQFISDFNYKINKSNSLNFGVNSKLYNIKPGELTPYKNALLTPIKIDKERALESAFFLSDNLKISEKLSFDFGFRVTNFLSLGKSTQNIYEENLPLSEATVVEVKEFKNNEVIKEYNSIEPRISARYLIMEDLSLKLSFDKTSQYIHLLSNNTTQSPTDTWKLSDLNIKPQIANQISFGIFKNINKNNLELSIEGYVKKTKDFLDYKVGADILLNQNIETELLQGEGKSYGIEFLIKRTSGKLNGWIGYTYSRSFVKLDSEFNEEIVNNGKYFPSNFDKPHDLSVVMNYKITKRYSFSSNFIYQTGRPITYPVGAYEFNGSNYTLYSDRNKFRIPDYYRLDIGLNIEGNHKIKKLAHSFVNISIYNVLGINNPYSVFFVTDDGKLKAYKTSIFSIPIPTVTYNFKF